ncbi:MAG TPA: undecaprenyl-diphosphate phosphatase, partial [Desulfatiglandales bacterium]|nr:undecaprenyl-diphosphate phosphatase [Desulfatiglandales bacterium]
MIIIFLGIVQGLTEFLPISSSGHLVLFQALLGFKEPQLMFDIFLHMGTLLAVCIFFRSDLDRKTPCIPYHPHQVRTEKYAYGQ